MQIVNASIITIGDELLIGQTVDTNSAFIAQELNKIGIWVIRRVAVGDNANDIRSALDEEREQSQVIIITGGLGPTADDITKPLLCDYFGARLIVNEEVLAHVKYLFEKIFRRTGPILERNLKQAEVPDNCIVLHNKRGTAPGMMWIASQASLNPSEGGTLEPENLNISYSSESIAPLNPPQGKMLKASLNPSEGGTSEPENLNISYGYETATPAIYSQLKKFVAINRSKPTEAEKVLWEIVSGKKLGGYKFRRQHIIGEYIADLVCLSYKLIIEVDGLIHQVPENKLSDEDREDDLKQKGFQVIRFTNTQVLKSSEFVINEILLQLNKRKLQLSESKNPPLEGREATSASKGAINVEGREATSASKEAIFKSSESQNPPLGGRGAIFVSLPGVPHEMKGLITDEVIPRLKKSFDLLAILHFTAFTVGQGESFIAELLIDFEASLPKQIKLAYLPNYGMVKLRLTAVGENVKDLEKELTPYFEKMKSIVKEWLVSDRDEGLENVIGRILKEKGLTMATAESCTGGNIARLITSVAGSSAYYNGSVVAYANDAKVKLLGVDSKTLEKNGAVSEETVRDMISGALSRFGADYALATSGIMGPDGGTDEKPVGTVWVAVGNKKKIEAKLLQFRFDRERNITMTSFAAMNFLRKFILENEPE